MLIYPYTSPIILDDDIFVQYGGQTGTTTSAQRQAAYLVAEKQATVDVGTFLLPTIVTGTYSYSSDRFISTDYGYVHRILSAKLIYIDNEMNCELGEETGCAFIFDDTFGYLDFSCITSHCYCGTTSPYPYQFQIVYEAGLPTGTASQPDFLLGLVIASQITLNEMIYPTANEGAGDVGIEAFSVSGYSEKRTKLKRTAYGNSARANKAAQLIGNSVRRARKALVI